MIGLILLYFVGKAFYDLAGLHQKSQWVFAILGVGSYYFGLFLGAILIGIIYELASPNTVESVSDVAISIMALPIGIVCCWGFYALLKRQWNKSPVPAKEEMLDSDLMVK